MFLPAASQLASPLLAIHTCPLTDPHTQQRTDMVKTQGVTIYGIPNCDTMKKARLWLDTHRIAHQFHDYKKSGIAPALLEGWVRQLGWEPLLNRAGTTFRKLPDADKSDLTAAKAIALMLAQPSLIKRPVLEMDRQILVGFKPEIYARNFGQPAPG